jgi:hypothetical protein
MDGIAKLLYFQGKVSKKGNMKVARSQAKGKNGTKSLSELSEKRKD